ncbi:MAG TPA: IclR family transcriptional regulator [Bauldia sp.]|nr:IclR family transcriptional regulator [Bauldia sp.]
MEETRRVRGSGETRSAEGFQPAGAKRAKARSARDARAGLPPLRGMARSFAVLEYLAASPGRVVDVTRGLGLPWATVHRTIIQLEKAGFLQRDAKTNRYEIGPRLWHVGSSYLANHRVLKAAQPYLSQLQEAEGIVVQITERIGNLAVAIYSAQRLAEDITKAHYGYHFPLHCGSKGQVLLAHEDPDFIDAYLRRDLERLTSETITDPAVLRGELAKIRRAGMALTVADVQPFTGSMSAPIRDASGKVVASLCFIFRKVLLRNDKRREELQDQLMHMAHSISIDLGWRPDQG